jgi:hypothetical protein
VNFHAAILQVSTPFFGFWEAACTDVWGVEKKVRFLGSIFGAGEAACRQAVTTWLFFNPFILVPLVCVCCRMYQATSLKKWEFPHFNLTPILNNVGISTFVTQKTITMLADCKNRMNHGGRCSTMADIVPHPRLQGVETLVNVLYATRLHS